MTESLEWVCRTCAHRWHSTTWRGCPKCRGMLVWCLDGQWWKSNRPAWTVVPGDVQKILAEATHE